LKGRTALLDKEEIMMSRIAIFLASSLVVGLATSALHAQQPGGQGGPGQGPQGQQKMQKPAGKVQGKASPVAPRETVKVEKAAAPAKPPESKGTGSRVGSTTSLR
jgi:hypothetical protein